MLLFELFETPPLNLERNIRNDVLDILTPFIGSGVPFVPVQKVLDKLHQLRTGVALDRGFLMDILDPKKIKAIEKIEGDRIYFNIGGAPDREVDDDQEEKDQEKIKSTAAATAKKHIRGRDNKAQTNAMKQATQDIGAKGGPI